MKKVKSLTTILSFVIMTVATFSALAQTKTDTKKNGPYIPNFQEGRIITQSDIGFLATITGVKTKGADQSKDVIVSGKKFSVNEKLTKDDAALITKEKTGYIKSHKLEEVSKSEIEAAKSKGDAICWNCPCHWVCNPWSGACWKVCDF